MRTNMPLTINQEQRRLLGFMGWKHGEALNDNVRGLLGWHFGTKGESVDAQGRRMGKLIAGKSVFMVHPRVLANWIMFYIDGKVSREDLMAVRMQYSVVPMVERKVAASATPLKVEGK